MSFCVVPDAKDFVEKSLVGEWGEEAGGPINVTLKDVHVPDVRLKQVNIFFSTLH